MRTVGWYMGVRVQVLGQPAVDRLLAVWLDGVADEQSGTMGGPVGHLFRVGADLLLTDSDGGSHPMRALGEGWPTPEAAAEHAVRRHRERDAEHGTYAGL